MSIARALTALLEVVDRDRQTRCETLLAEAQAAADALLAAARADSRRRLRSSVKAERAHTATLAAAARARLEAAQRQAQHAQARQAIAAGAERLPEALRAIWRDGARRRRWLASAVQGAARRLPLKDWRIEFPPTLPRDDLEWLRQEAEALGVGKACCQAEPGIDAGITIRVGNASFDATVSGLLADRTLVDGRLRHFFEVS